MPSNGQFGVVKKGRLFVRHLTSGPLCDDIILPQEGNYFKTLTLKEATDFTYENVGKLFKFSKKETYSKLNKEKNPRKPTRIMDNNLTNPLKTSEFIILQKIKRKYSRNRKYKRIRDYCATTKRFRKLIT